MKTKTNAYLPIQMEEVEYGFIATPSEETLKYLPDIPLVGAGVTKEAAMEDMFFSLNVLFQYHEEKHLAYERMIPLVIGPKGSRWIMIFGFFISIRYGKQNKGGWFIPFTKVNISIQNRWTQFRSYLKEAKAKGGQS